jgi:hypothetical protein
MLMMLFLPPPDGADITKIGRSNISCVSPI